MFLYDFKRKNYVKYNMEKNKLFVNMNNY